MLLLLNQVQKGPTPQLSVLAAQVVGAVLDMMLEVEQVVAQARIQAILVAPERKLLAERGGLLELLRLHLPSLTVAQGGLVAEEGPLEILDNLRFTIQFQALGV
jgi:hypothetical protein